MERALRAPSYCPKGANVLWGTVSCKVKVCAPGAHCPATTNTAAHSEDTTSPAVICHGNSFSPCSAPQLFSQQAAGRAQGSAPSTPVLLEAAAAGSTAHRSPRCRTTSSQAHSHVPITQLCWTWRALGVSSPQHSPTPSRYSEHSGCQSVGNGTRTQMRPQKYAAYIIPQPVGVRGM